MFYGLYVNVLPVPLGVTVHHGYVKANRRGDGVLFFHAITSDGVGMRRSLEDYGVVVKPAYLGTMAACRYRVDVVLAYPRDVIQSDEEEVFLRRVQATSGRAERDREVG